MSTITAHKIEPLLAARRLMTPWVLWPAIAMWFGGIAWGFSLLAAYKSASGDQGEPPPRWPLEAKIPAPALRPTLLIFSHPHCPCTRASFRELERVVAKSTGPVDLRVIFVGLDGAAPQATSLTAAATDLPFAKISYDNDDLGKLFRIKTSGHVLLYDAQGQLQFSGGVNPSRGHEGDSAGSAALTALLQNRTSDTTTAPVYGCPLLISDGKCELVTCKDARTGP